MSHPSKDIISSKGRELVGKKIALLVTSSVASFKAPEIARELMRHGADVQAVISPSTERMVGADLLEWATGNTVVTRLTGKLEHIALAGKSQGHVDLVLVAPATANTIGKLPPANSITREATASPQRSGPRLPVTSPPRRPSPCSPTRLSTASVRRLSRLA